MRIKSISTRVLSLPADSPFRTSLGVLIRSAGHILIEARSDEGHAGYGYVVSLYGYLKALKSAIEEVRELVVGKDPFAVKSLWRTMMAHTGWFGPAGLMHAAISGIDMALWDLLGKVVDRPLAVLLGSARDKVPCYHVGFWRSTSLPELAKEAELYRDQGFKAVKMKVGGEDHLDKEIERVRVVRGSLGEDIALMVDPNQAWTPDIAISMGERLREYDIYWLEDPVPYDDMDGRARVAECLDIPIASGEEVPNRAGFAQLVVRRAADIFNVDLQRVAGITGWLDVASFLEARNCVLTAHALPEVQCQLIAASPKGLTVEYLTRSAALFKQGPKIDAGFIELPKGPGLGLEIDEEAVKKYEVK
ncbi:MAG: mandelate racemase/muconate lactonizing enzyme family protein [Chloroflexi bacterium]|nr:mandelate racemase/muconate lactonizing enzyme family protein [Chloroflexota bacterium]